MRLLPAVVLCCIFTQALLLPAQRAAGPGHFHVTPEAHELVEDHGSPGHHDKARHLHSDAGSAGDNGMHSHGEIAHHDHSGPHGPVVHTAEADPETSQTQAPKVGMFDLTAAWAHWTGVAAAVALAARFMPHTKRFRSHVTVPLDRPPRGNT